MAQEKQKEESFLKKLDKEQGRIFKIDSKRYIEEEQDKRKNDNKGKIANLTVFFILGLNQCL